MLWNWQFFNSAVEHLIILTVDCKEEYSYHRQQIFLILPLLMCFWLGCHVIPLFHQNGVDTHAEANAWQGNLQTSFQNRFAFALTWDKWWHNLPTSKHTISYEFWGHFNIENNLIQSSFAVVFPDRVAVICYRNYPALWPEVTISWFKIRAICSGPEPRFQRWKCMKCSLLVAK